MDNQKTAKDDHPTVLIIEMAIGIYGGIERVMLNVLPLLNARWRVVYCDLWANPEYAGLLRAAGVEVLHLMPESRRKYVGGKGTLLRPLKVAMKLPWLALTLIRLRRWIGRNRPDVLYFNRWEVIRAMSPAVPDGIPCIFQSHGYAGPNSFPKRVVLRLNERFCRVIAVSQSALEILAEAGVRRDKLVRVYNGLDAVAVRTAAQADGPPLPARTPGHIVFAHAAAICPDKAQDVSIEALGRVANPAVKLWICGGIQTSADAAYEQSLKQRVSELGLEQRVSFLGWRKDAPRVMAAADVVILPSQTNSESFGMVLVEGMALGKPCIGTSRGGVPEVIADGVTGLVREPTPEAFADAMNLLASSPEVRQKMGAQAKSRVEGSFGLQRQVEELGAALDAARLWPASAK